MVTDVSVVRTDPEGYFEILADGGRAFLSVTVPRGYGFHGMFRPLSERPLCLDLVPLREPDERHAFLALADPQPSNAAQAALFRAAIPDIAATARSLCGPVFAMVVGDIVGDAPGLYPAHAEAVKGIGVPVLHVAGNHDDKGVARRFGPDRFSFDRGLVQYVVLDNVHRRFGGATSAAWSPPAPRFKKRKTRRGSSACEQEEKERIESSPVSMVTVFVPTPLRDCCGGKKELRLDGPSVRAVLEEIERLYPPLYRSVCDDTGAVRRHVNVWVNSTHMRDREGLDTALAAGDHVTILPAVSGG